MTHTCSKPCSKKEAETLLQSTAKKVYDDISISILSLILLIFILLITKINLLVGK